MDIIYHKKHVGISCLHYKWKTIISNIGVPIAASDMRYVGSGVGKLGNDDGQRQAKNPEALLS